MNRNAPPRSQLVTLAALAFGLGVAPIGRADAVWIQDGTPICTDPQTQQNPSITPMGSGGAIIAWEDSRFGATDIYAQKVDGNGAMLWSLGGVAVCSAANTQRSPVVQGQFGGGAIVAWTDSRNAAGANRDDIYAQRLDTNGVPIWVANGIPVAAAPVYETTPLIISDLNPTLSVGGAIVMYLHYPSGSPSVCEFDAQHVSESGVLWAPASTGGVRISGPIQSSVTRNHPAITTDGIGSPFSGRGAVIGWDEFNPQSSNLTHVLLNRVDTNGAVQWGSGIAVTATALSQNTPAVASVSGTTVAAWVDNRSLQADIYAQRVSSAGARQWLADGVPVCRATGSQSQPVVVAGNSGSSIVLWTDSRSGDAKAYAQRLDTAGTPLWGTDGIPLCLASGDQVGLRAVTDGSGGAVVTWEDRRNATSDIFAQRVDQNGVLVWGPYGVPISVSTGHQLTPRLVGDGSAGAVITWLDVRNPNGDIYALRTFDSSNVTAVPDTPPVPSGTLRLDLISGNPGRGPVLLTLDLAEPALVQADVFDVVGHRIDGVLEAGPLAAGPHELHWDGRDALDRPAPAGLYFLRVRAGARQQTLRLIRVE